MEAVAFEKKVLLGQWRSSLVAMAKRDAALQELQVVASRVGPSYAGLAPCAFFNQRHGQ
jgi:hypothetical protein